MALIVEDGTVVDGAESYCSVSFANDYHISLGNADWDPLPPSEKEQLLRKATKYMLRVYRPKWRGYRATNSQTLDWPRLYAPRVDAVSGYAWYGGMNYYASNELPVEIKEACAELALRALTGELFADTGGIGSTSGAVVRQKLGPIEVEYASAGATASAVNRKYGAVDALLSAFFGSAGVVRA